jgi:hypothetical protein
MLGDAGLEGKSADADQGCNQHTGSNNSKNDMFRHDIYSYIK